MPLEDLLITNPTQFMLELAAQPDFLSSEMARRLDIIDPLAYTSSMFDIRKLIPLAGHSLGPLFEPALEAIRATHELQKEKLHAGHFAHSHPDGRQSGNWFECDRHRPALEAAREVLGFAEWHEFNFTAAGLSENLGTIMDTLFRLTKKDWEQGKTKIAMLKTEFFSDQAIAASVMKRAIRTAKDFDIFEKREEPKVSDEVLKITPDQKGIYDEQEITAFIKKNADKIRMICLSAIVFNTGQCLNLGLILKSLRDIIKENNIHVILDLAHTVGNRPINLEALEVVTAAVGCGYKHLSGSAGTSFGIYVNRHVDFEKYPTIQGWKSAYPDKVFSLINSFGL